MEEYLKLVWLLAPGKLVFIFQKLVIYTGFHRQPSLEFKWSEK